MPLDDLRQYRFTSRKDIGPEANSNNAGKYPLMRFVFMARDTIPTSMLWVLVGVSAVFALIILLLVLFSGE